MTRVKHISNRQSLCRLVVISMAVAALVLSCMIIGGCGRGKPGAEAQSGAAQASTTALTPVSVTQARRDTIREELELTGSCEAYEEVDVMAEMAGKVISVSADVGDHVERGDMLVRLDTSLVSKQRVQAEKGVDSAQASLNQAMKSAELTDSQTVIEIRQAEQGVAAAKEQLRKAEQRHELTREQVDSGIQQAKVGVASAQAGQRDVLAGARTQEIAQGEAQVRLAEADLSLKKMNYDRYRSLHAQGAVAEATLDQHRTAYEVAQQTLTQTRHALSLSKEGARQEQKRMAELQVEQAAERLKLAEAGRREVGIAARDVESARVGLRQAEETLRLARASRKRYDVSVAGVRSARAGVGSAAAGRDLARTTESKYTVVAPLSGVIARRNVDVGEAASPSFAVMRIVDNDPIRVNCIVSEMDVSKLHVGDDGIAAIDGLPGTEFFGRIVDISPQAQQGRRSYVARVEIDNPDGAIKAGMFARVRLTISEKPDVIVVSRDALVERDGVFQAYVVKNGAISIQKVKVGVSNGREMEVTSGLSARDSLVVGSQALLADGQKVKPVPVAPRQSEAQPSSRPASDEGEPDQSARPAGQAGASGRPSGATRRAPVEEKPAAEKPKPAARKAPASAPKPAGKKPEVQGPPEPPKGAREAAAHDHAADRDGEQPRASGRRGGRPSGASGPSGRPRGGQRPERASD